MELIQKIKKNNIFSFFLTAVLGASVNFISQIPFKTLFDNLGVSYPLQWSVFAGYMMATVVSFVPQKNLVFNSKNSGNAKREMIKYIFIALMALLVQEVFTTWGMKYVSVPYLIHYSDTFQMKFAHLIGMGFSFLANFYGHKFLTFRSTGLYDKVRKAK